MDTMQGMSKLFTHYLYVGATKNQMVLSLVRIHDETLELLNLDGCKKVADASMEAIADNCFLLNDLDVSKYALTDYSLDVLSYGVKIDVSDLFLTSGMIPKILAPILLKHGEEHDNYVKIWNLDKVGKIQFYEDMVTMYDREMGKNQEYSAQNEIGPFKVAAIGYQGFLPDTYSFVLKEIVGATTSLLLEELADMYLSLESDSTIAKVDWPFELLRNELTHLVNGCILMDTRQGMSKLFTHYLYVGATKNQMVLSLVRIHDETLELLNLDGCKKVADASMEAIADNCFLLNDLDVSKYALTDYSLDVLSYGVKELCQQAHSETGFMIELRVPQSSPYILDEFKAWLFDYFIVIDASKSEGSVYELKREPDKEELGARDKEKFTKTIML
ncbi:hypothetical protein RND71_014450 [Anisodus tanguticus]|uniref:Uncharacterized protein n=1 Tax=Anisodus tanguticus TaxID=243964 RepID=A0AAE1SAN0_9SOLA|nr:hypothetical protein RND71_014450 [Anisodus tanguticus]